MASISSRNSGQTRHVIHHSTLNPQVASIRKNPTKLSELKTSRLFPIGATSGDVCLTLLLPSQYLPQLAKAKTAMNPLHIKRYAIFGSPVDSARVSRSRRLSGTQSTKCWNNASIWISVSSRSWAKMAANAARIWSTTQPKLKSSSRWHWTKNRSPSVEKKAFFERQAH